MHGETLKSVICVIDRRVRTVS